MLLHYCEKDPTEEDRGESISDPDSLMGLPHDECTDHWVHDETIATWRMIVAPRRGLYCPEEWPRVWGDFAPVGPLVPSLRNARLTILKDGWVFRDNWRSADPKGQPKEL